MLPHFNYVYAPTPRRLDLKTISEKFETVSKDGDLDNRKTDVLNRGKCWTQNSCESVESSSLCASIFLAIILVIYSLKYRNNRSSLKAIDLPLMINFRNRSLVEQLIKPSHKEKTTISIIMSINECHQIFTIRQQNCGDVMFSVMSLSFCPQWIPLCRASATL